MPLALSIFWVPLPYILSHADWLHSARLPLDGPLMCLAALGLVGLFPISGRYLLRGEDYLKGEEAPNP
jgi:hypothetical protein